MARIFITGTDTDIGKTVVSAWLCLQEGADYWKPIQSGTRDGTDEKTLQNLVPNLRCHPSRFTLSQPLSPHESAKRDGVEISLEDFQCPKVDSLVVEGAGGVLVPLNSRHTMLDLMEHLALPVLLVARSGLGTINHTLLSLMALRQRNLSLIGVVLCGNLSPANKQAIEEFGRIKVVAEIPLLDTVDTAHLTKIPPPLFFR